MVQIVLVVEKKVSSRIIDSVLPGVIGYEYYVYNPGATLTSILSHGGSSTLKVKTSDNRPTFVLLHDDPT